MRQRKNARGCRSRGNHAEFVNRARKTRTDLGAPFWFDRIRDSVKATEESGTHQSVGKIAIPKRARG